MDASVVVAPNLTNDSHMSLSTSYQPLTVACAERSSTPEDKHALEQRGLARAITSVDKRQTGGEAKLSVLDAAEVANGDLAKAH
jgi:hypothetical protein